MKKPLSQEEIDTLLKSKSISDRSRAMRHYEHFGTVEDISFLIQMAATDPSVGVRNGAADAIGDVLSRYRLEPYKQSLSVEDRHVYMRQFRRIKVQQTPSVNLAYAGLGTSRALSILLSSFVDPRVEMQNCAAAGLRCFCLSQDALGDEVVEDKLINLLKAGTLDIPGIAHVVRLCAEAGYHKVIPLLDDLPDLGELGEVVTATRVQLAKAQEHPVGLWCSNGLDALEFNPSAERDERFLLVTDNALLECKEGVWSNQSDALKGQSRRLYFRPIGSAESIQAIQTKKATWKAAQTVDVQILLQQETQLDLPSNPYLSILAEWLEIRLKDTQKNTRYLAILFMRSEMWSECGQYLEKGMSYKKVSNDLWYVEARRLVALGQNKQAVEALDKCLALAKRDGTMLVRLCQELKSELLGT